MRSGLLGLLEMATGLRRPAYQSALQRYEQSAGTTQAFLQQKRCSDKNEAGESRDVDSVKTRVHNLR
ncbi:unnamed protein product, partial [Amoebophrya sp. A25]|eukprot:GSA25T00023078001.1